MRVARLQESKSKELKRAQPLNHKIVLDPPRGALARTILSQENGLKKSRTEPRYKKDYSAGLKYLGNPVQTVKNQAIESHLLWLD
jgi:hypothetical protein